ncbi:unnamed protein product [Trichobilharzia regenti]|nr:unnamed protein product [Trichobilharzia regenti]
MSVAVFIQCSEAKQSYGAKGLDNTECKDNTWPDELIKCIKHLDICWKDETVAEAGKIYVLNLLFCGLNPKSHPRYEIYLALIECAEKLGVLNQVITDPKKFFKIFVSGDLNTFKKFLAKHPNFLNQNNLNEEACIHKLRLLTLMQLSENLSELSYSEAAAHLNLEIEEVEPFIIEAVRQRAVACKLDQVQKKILITGAFPRTFGRPQWINLHDTLIQWRSHLGTVQSSLSMMVQNKVQ